MIDTRLLRYAGGARRYIALCALTQWVGLLANAAMIFAAARFIGRVADGSADSGALAATLTIAVVAALIKAVSGFAAAKASFRAAYGVKKALRGRLYKKLAEIGGSYSETLSTADILQTATEGVDHLEVYFGRYMPQLLYSVAAPVTLFALLAPIQFEAALVLLICAPLIPLLLFGIGKMAKRVMRRQWKSYVSLGERFLENLQGMTALKVYGADAAKQDEMALEAEHFRQSTMRVLRMQLGSIIFMDLIAFGGAALGVAAAARSGGALSSALAAILLSAEFFIPLRQLGSYFHVAMNGAAAGTGMLAILDASAPPDGARAVSLNNAGNPAAVIRGLSFSYGETEVLRDVSFDIPSKGMVSLVGGSGCGKSTIAALITARQRGYGGSVALGGAELREIARESLAGSVTLVTHEGYVFAGTARSNLRLAKPDATDAEMRSVLECVRLWGEVDDLDAPLLERGANLSGGQRQRLCLARAMLRGGMSIYIFDEVTSNIDAESESAIMGVVRDLAETSAVLLISHRLANVAPSKRIYLLDGGKIVECGAHAELLAQNGLYARLWREQRELESYVKGAAR